MKAKIKYGTVQETLAERRADLEAQLRVARALLEQEEAALNKIRRDGFVAAGGCDRCGGRGWIVAWDTLDSLSGCYAEYGPCPAGDACTARSVGIDTSYRTKYDKLRGTPLPSQSAYETFCPSASVVRGLEAQMTVLKADESSAQHFKVGQRVVVVRGRKLPVGHVGRIVWVDNWGTGYPPSRVGVETDETDETDPKRPERKLAIFVPSCNVEQLL